MSKISIADVLDLSVAERIQLAEDIWDTIPKASEAPKLTEAQRAEISSWTVVAKPPQDAKVVDEFTQALDSAGTYTPE